MNTTENNKIYNDDYEKPAIEIIEMEIESAILQSSTDSLWGTNW